MRLVASCAAATLLLAGCGGSGSGSGDVLAETAAKLGKIRSGTLNMRLLVRPRAGRPFGFHLRGPFSIADGSALPVLRVAYTQIANGKRATVTVISTGNAAYVQNGGRTIQLSEARAQTLRSAAGGGSGPGGLASLQIDDWFADAKQTDGGEVGGSETDKVSSKLDVVAATNDLLSLLRRSGRAVSTVRGREADRLRHAVRSAKIEVYSGKRDRLLRRLAIDVDFGFDVPSSLRAALGNVVGARVHFALGVDRPNRPIHVSAP